MIRKYFPFCFYVLVSVLCLGKPLLAYPSENLNEGGAIPSLDAISETDSITPLKIGDKIPDELWDYAFPVVSPHTDQVQYLTLGDFRDKLIILDFWATWCAPCISSLHKLDTLQQEFVDDLLVFPTSYEAEDKVRPFFADKGYSLPTAFEETHLKKYFPYRSIPHQVWIKDGEVMAVPHHEYTNANNISKAITGKDLTMSQKDLVVFDAQKPLLIDGNGGGGDKLLYQSIITKNINTNTVGYIPANDKAFLFYNGTALSLLKRAFSNIARNKNRIIYELNDSLFNLLEFGDRKRTGESDKDKALEEWLDKYTFSYSLTSSVKLGKPEVYRIVQNDLNTYFSVALGIYGAVEERPMDCLVVEKSGNANRLMTKGAKSQYIYNSDSTVLVNKKPDMLMMVLNTIAPDKILLDHSGIEGNIDLVLPHSLIGDLNATNKYLRQYGLVIRNKTMPVKMVVIKETEE